MSTSTLPELKGCPVTTRALVAGVHEPYLYAGLAPTGYTCYLEGSSNHL